MKTYNVKKRGIYKEIVLYGIIGSFSSGLDGFVFFLFQKLNWNVYISNFISINLGIFSSFFLNTFFNYKVYNKLLLRAIKYFSICYLGLILSTLIIFIGVDVLNKNKIIIKIISVILVAAFQFLVNRGIAFK
jgi:putative flippase GtrA